jgi:hypothetical protein
MLQMHGSVHDPKQLYSLIWLNQRLDVGCAEFANTGILSVTTNLDRVSNGRFTSRCRPFSEATASASPTTHANSLYSGPGQPTWAANM